jgi:hypothetical protein
MVYEYGEQRWNEIDGKTEELRKISPQCDFVQNKSHMD